MEKIAEAAKEIQPSVFDKPKGYKEPVKKKKPAPKVEDDDGDALMNFDNGPPKRAPPKNIGKAPPKKKAAGEVEEESKGEDELMDFGNEPPKKAPPKNIGKAPPKKVKKEVEEEKKEAPKPSGGAKGPVKAITSVSVAEEDLGSGLSPE